MRRDLRRATPATLTGDIGHPMRLRALGNPDLEIHVTYNLPTPLQLSVGTRLGPYEIVSPLGAGGMGEVYRARDTRLNRDVAIKVLPTHLAADEMSRARFEREAHAIAALSHPNILAIHDVGQANEVAFAVTELLEGETLRERLEREPIPLRKIVQIGADIALGLAAAHDKGVVHRDIKPDNVFITADGHVKILDFGLAKALAPEGSGATSGSLNTRTVLKRTEAGTVMGTVGYMSPEQVKGQDADHRGDIFSLGCVLYEMATGRRAFERETAAETMTAILREEPPDTPLETRGIPAALDQLIRQCLEKRPEERFQSARDLAFALRTLSGTTHASGSSAVVTSRRRPYAITATVVALTAAAAFFAWRFIPRPVTTSPSPQLATFAQITDKPGIETNPTLSPDGKTVVYVGSTGGDSALFLQRVGTRSAVRLSGPAPASDSEPALSPDGERIAFRSERDGGGIFLMSVSGESVTRLTDFGFSPTWSPDGSHIAVSATAFAFSPSDVQSFPGALTVVNVQSGQQRVVAKSGMQPAWSPSGSRIAYWTLHKGGQRDLWTVASNDSAADAARILVTDDTALDWSPAWAPDGRALYFSSTRGGTMNLWRVPIDQNTGRILAEPEPLTTPSTWTGRFSLSRDGTRLAFGTLDFRSTLLRAPFDPAKEALTGPSVPMLKGTRAIRDHQLSPDGQWIAFAEAGSQEDLFVARIDGSQYRRLTDDGFRDRGPTWSPDGTRIGFYSDRGGGYDMWTIRPDGSGLTALTNKKGSPGFPVWSPDGLRMAFGFAGEWHIIETTAGKGAVSTPANMPKPVSPFAPASWSPDGQRIVGLTGLPTMGLTVYSIATQQFTPVPGEMSRGYWVFPTWLSDGRRVILRRPDGISVVDTTTGAGRSLIQVGGYMTGCSVGISRDNRWITYTETATEGDIWIATMKPAGQAIR